MDLSAAVAPNWPDESKLIVKAGLGIEGVMRRYILIRLGSAERIDAARMKKDEQFKEGGGP
jgi:hypothetical protein